MRVLRYFSVLTYFLVLSFGFSTPTVAQEVISPSEITTDVIPDENVYTVWNRIRDGFQIPDMQNKVVDRNLRLYLKDPSRLRRMIERSQPFLYHIVELVNERNLPTELALLPFVESAFMTKAKSRAKAAGLWQFMPATGKHYDLNQSLWTDERYDIFESTNAALNYLEKLYTQFGDWQLALAAYNWGEGNLSRAIKRNERARRSTQYMALKMPKETRNYYPKLQAIKNIIQNPEQYNINLPVIYNEPALVQITKSKDIDVKKAAQFANMSEDDFIELNPSFNRPVIVASHNNRMLLPMDALDQFVENLVSYSMSGQPLSNWTTYKLQPGDTLASVAKRAMMTEKELREANQIPLGRRVKVGSLLLVNKSSGIGNYSENISADTIGATLSLQQDFRRVKYRVRRGDTLGRIAKRLGVSQQKIKRENRLRSNLLRVGQNLVITVPTKIRQSASYSNRVNSNSRFYVVRRGDTLGRIASRHGISVNALRSANSIRGNAIRVGQRLVIDPKGKPARRSVVLENIPNQAKKRIAKRPLEKRSSYVVRKGDTLFSIATSANMSVNQLKQINGLMSDQLKIGQKLKLTH